MKRRISFLGGKIRLRSSEGIRACHDTLYIYIYIICRLHICICIYSDDLRLLGESSAAEKSPSSRWIIPSRFLLDFCVYFDCHHPILLILL